MDRDFLTVSSYGPNRDDPSFTLNLMNGLVLVLKTLLEVTEMWSWTIH